MKTNLLQRTNMCSRHRLLAAAIAICFVNASHALPVGPQIAAGSASFNQTGNALTINNSNNAILNWQTFNIGANEAVRFNQTSASSSVLNRVLANDPSSLLGQLTSNGRVWLVNPAGILVGPGAHIDTAGFVASTLSIRNEDFLAGKLNFQNTPGAGSVVNQGNIRTPGGGSVYLIAPDVSNEGIISTPQGETILAAGQTVQLLDTATPGVKVEVTGATGNVTNLGSIVAAAGRIGMVGVLVRNSGNLNASSVVNEGGRIFLKASKDTYVDKNAKVIATGSMGGSIEVLGNRVAVMDNAQIDASGQQGGGTVLVGGDYQGKNSAIQNSQVTYLGAGAEIKANAIENGDGGKVIVWADDTTRALGSISARGGDQSGNGGFVETSGKRFLDFQGRVDTRAPHGKVGSLLLDPTSIYIAYTLTNAQTAGMVSSDTSADLNAPSILASGTASDSLLTVNNLQIALSGSAVTVSTANATGTGVGDITVVDPVVWTTANKLTLSANRNITINSSLTGSNGSLSLLSSGSVGTVGGTAGITVNQLEIASAGTGGVNLVGTNHVNTLAANLTGAGAALNFNNSSAGAGLAIGVVGGTTGVSALGNISINENGAGKNISVNESVSSPGTVSIGVTTGAGTLTEAAGKAVSGNQVILASTGGAITLNGTVSGTTNANIHAGAGSLSTGTTGLVIAPSITLQNDPAMSGAIGAVGTPFRTSSPGGAGNANISIGAAGYGPSAVYLQHTGDATLTAVNEQATAPNEIGASNNLTATSIATTGNLILSAGNMLTIPGNLSAGNITLGGDLINITAAAINAGSGVVWLHPSTSLRPVDLGAKVGLANTLELSTNELNTMTAGTLRVGSMSAGSLNVSAAIAPVNAGVLSFESGGNVTQTGAGTISANNLAIQANGNVLLGTLSNSVSNLAALAGSGSNNFNFKTGTALNVANALDGVNGISMPGFVNPNGVISLTSSGAITQTAGAMLAGSALNANGSNVLLSNANPTGVISGSTTSGDFVYHSANGINVTTVNGINGITVQGVANVKLTADTSGISLSQPINGGSGTFYLDAGSAGFFNNAGTTPMITSGRWLVYAGGPSGVIKNGLTSSFRHYNATFANYSSPGETGNGFIYASTPGALTVDTTLVSGTASNTYGQTPTAVFGVNLVGNFDKEDLSGSPFFNPAITSTTNAGSYSVTYAGGLASAASFSGSTLANPVSYTFAPGTSLAYMVNRAALAISASLIGTTSKTYDSTTTATLTPANFLLGGFVGGDSASVTKTTGTYSGKNVGSYIQVSTSLAPSDFSPGGNTNLANYTLPTSATGNIGSITPASLSVSGLKANDKVYDATAVATINTGTVMFAGVIGGDSVTLGAASASFSDKNVGTAKPVTVGGITLSGADAGNYMLSSSSVSTTANITPATIANVSGITANNKTYDGNTSATLNTGSATFNGKVGSDVLATSGATGSFSDSAVGTGKTVSIFGITLAGSDAGNYILANNTASTTASIISAPSSLDQLVNAVTSSTQQLPNSTSVVILPPPPLSSPAVSSSLLGHSIGGLSGEFGGNDKSSGDNKKDEVSTKKPEGKLFNKKPAMCS